jgi:phosphocarrier protein FPr
MRQGDAVSILSAERIRLGAAAASKEEAIRLSGDLLVTTQCVKPRYVDGMLARESTMSTYLGNGVAIPHGEYDNREDILTTGISVLQIPTGVVWEPGENVYLVIGIAASSDEHVGVLAALAEAIEDEEITQLLHTTDDPQVIMKHLGG